MRLTARISAPATDLCVPGRVAGDGAAPAHTLTPADAAADGNGHSHAAGKGNGHSKATLPGSPNGNGNGHAHAVTGLTHAPRGDSQVRLARFGRLIHVFGGETLAGAFAVLLGVAATVYVRGYEFGESNQSVYLLRGLRDARPWLLRNDWLASQTTEYHVTFGTLTRMLMRADLLKPGFFLGYLLLVILSQVAWLKLVRRLGGTHVTYLVSVLLYYLSNGGLGLGATEMFQDGAFLPSNIANVAMLWGVYAWVAGRTWGSAIAFGIAGAFHLNHAVMSAGLWGALSVWECLRPAAVVRPERDPDRPDALGRRLGPLAGGLGIILLLSLPNLIPVLTAARQEAARQALSLREYVDLFVRLRAPHHFDPSTWPLSLWLGFLWPIPLAALAVRRWPKTPARREAARVFVLFCAAIGVSLVGAGIWYVSEPLIQMCFYRFSIYPKLLSCIGAAYWLGKLTLPARKQARFGIAVAAAGGAVVAAVVLNSMDIAPLEFLRQATRPVRALLFLGAVTVVCGCTAVGLLRPMRTPFYAAGLLALVMQLSAAPRWLGQDNLSPREADYAALCDWVKGQTPLDAVFLVPPNEEIFRLRAERAIVVNFKGVPPLRGELPEWRDRLQAVLAIDDLRALPRGMTAAGAAIGDRYDSLPLEHLVRTARRYNARYIVLPSAHRLADRVVVARFGWYQLCDVSRL